MAKETRLEDDAAIYQRREEQSEKEKFSSMTFKEKLTYFKAYYLAKVMVVVVILCFAGYFLYSVFGPKMETVLSVAVIDGCLTSDEGTALQEEMDTYLDLDSEKYETYVDTTYYLSDSEYSMTNQEKLMTYVAAKDIDVIIAPKEEFESYAENGYFSLVSDLLPSDLFSSLADNFLYASGEDVSYGAYGIYLKGYNYYDETGTLIVDPVIGIISNSEYPDNAVGLIQYFYDQGKFTEQP